MRLSDILKYRISTEVQYIDDIPRLSSKSESKSIWKSILENNYREYISLLKSIDNPDYDVIVWACSLDYSNGVDTLLSILGLDFIDKNIHRFLLLGNTTGIDKEYMINGRWKNIYENLLNNDIMNYLRNTERLRGSHRLYKDYVRSLCLSEISRIEPGHNKEYKMYLIYYMSIHGIEYSLESLDVPDYLEYISNISCNRNLYRNLVNCKDYKKCIDYLIDRGITTDQLIAGDILKTRVYNKKCYEYLMDVLYNGEHRREVQLISGFHTSVLYNRIDFDHELSVEDLELIEDHIQDNYIEYDGMYYLSWNNMKIDKNYLELIMEMELDQEMYVMEIKSSNILNPIGKYLNILKDRINIRISFDYYRTDTNILWDLISHGYSDEELKEQIILNNDYILMHLIRSISV